MREIIKASGSNIFVEPIEEIQEDIWKGKVHSLGYYVPKPLINFDVISGDCYVIYDKKDAIEISYNGEVVDSITHYKIHGKIIIEKEERKKPNVLNFEGLEWTEE